MLDGDRVGVGVEIRQGLVFGDPAAVDLVGDDQLTSLVINLQVEVFAEISERYFRPKRGAEVPDQTGPVVEVQVLS